MADRFKLALRRTYREVREKLSPTYQKKASSRVCQQIRALEQYRYAKRIALYQANAGEINLVDLWNTAPLQGKFCYFPVLTDNKALIFLPATPATSFVTNHYGIAEPDVDKTQAIATQELDIIFLPLVCFDEKGTRLGMGAGYYDRTLVHVKDTLLIGVAYDFQRQSYIDAQQWDIPLAAIITQSGTYWSKA